MKILLLLCYFSITHSQDNEKISVINQWKTLDFDYPTVEGRQKAIQAKTFIPGNSLPVDVDYWPIGGKMFMTIPKFRDGVPASLVTIENRANSGKLKPYPDWSWHRRQDCSGLTSVFRTQIDQCGRLWAIDSGVVELTKFPRRRLCPPKLVAFDLAKDQLIDSYEYPNTLLTDNSILATVAVDMRGSCSDTFVYVADVGGYQILVLDVRRRAFWRVQTNSMYPTPKHGHFNTNGVEFDLMDGVISLALTPERKDPKLFYHAFASLSESVVPTSVLRNESLFVTGFNMATSKFRTTDDVRPSQTAPEVFDSNGNLYFAPVSQNAIFCWNSQLPYTERNFIPLVKDNTKLQFTTGMKLYKGADGEDVIYMLTGRMQLFMVNRVNQSEVNTRIIKASVSQLTQGTGCAPRTGTFKFPAFSIPTSYSSRYRGSSTV